MALHMSKQTKTVLLAVYTIIATSAFLSGSKRSVDSNIDDLTFTLDRSPLGPIAEKLISGSRGSDVNFVVPIDQNTQFRIQVPKGFKLNGHIIERDFVSLGFMPQQDTIHFWKNKFLVQQVLSEGGLQGYYNRTVKEVTGKIAPKPYHDIRNIKTEVITFNGQADNEMIFIIDVPQISKYGQRQIIGVRAVQGPRYTVAIRYAVRYFTQKMKAGTTQFSEVLYEKHKGMVIDTLLQSAVTDR